MTIPELLAGWLSVLQGLGVPIGALPFGLLVGYLTYRALRRFRRVGATTVPQGPAVEFVPTGVLKARVWTVEGDRTVRVPTLVHSPSIAPGRNLRFVLVLAGIFTALAVGLLAFYRPIFGAWDRLVGLVGAVLYWPQGWPGVYGSVSHTPLVYDYIFPMYLALIVSWPLAAALAGRQFSLPASRRWLLPGIFGLYLVAESVVDALFFTVPGLSVRNLSLLVRAVVGGMFLTMTMYATFALPVPLARLPVKFPRDRRTIWRFFGSAAAAVAISAAFLYSVSYVLELRGIIPVFTVLLLLPAVTLPVWATLNRPFYFRYWRQHPRPPGGAFHPSVTIIIPAFNEEEDIRDAILSADRASENYAGPVTIVVGNDGSTDATSQVARRAIRELVHARGMVVDLPHGGKSNALNAALRLAEGEVIVRLDADSRISEKTGFAPAVAYLANREVGGVQGQIHPRQKEGWPRKLRAMEIAWQHLFLRPGAMSVRAAEVIDGAFSVFRRADLLALNGWLPWNGEDTEISIRLQRLGYRICIAFDAQGYEDVPSTYATLRKQRIRWTRGGVFANARNYPALFSPAIEFGGLAILFYYALVLRAGARTLVFVYLALLTAILGVPGILHAAYLLFALLLLRSLPLSFFLIRMRRYDVLPWIPIWPILGVVKSLFRFEAFGTILHGAVPEFY